MDLAWQQLGHAYLQKGMAAEAVDALERAAALSGARDSAHLAYAHAVTGRPDLAAQILDAVLASPDIDLLAFHIALAYSGLGDDDQAFAWLERAGRLVHGASRWSPASGGCTGPGSLGMRVELRSVPCAVLLILPAAGFRRLHGDPRWERLASRLQR
jgi:tetratricopeptide (TPR) repeat protein